jgi:hypothetical protein
MNDIVDDYSYLAMLVEDNSYVLLFNLIYVEWGVAIHDRFKYFL